MNPTPTALSVAEAKKAQQLERAQFERMAGVRLDAHGHIIREETSAGRRPRRRRPIREEDVRPGPCQASAPAPAPLESKHVR